MAIPFLNNINLDDNQLQNAKLHVTSSTPTAAQAQIYFDSTAGILAAKYYSNATDKWVTVSEYGVQTSTFINLTKTQTNGTDAKFTLQASLSATGTPSSTSYLRGDNTWSPISGIYDWTISDGTNSEIIASGDTVTFTGTGSTTTSYDTATNTLTIDSGNETITLTGEVTGSGTTSIATTVANGVLDIDNFTAATIVTEAEGIANNDNDTTIPTSAAVKDYVDTNIVGGLVYQGGYDAATNTPDLDGPPSPNPIKKGWTYTVTVDGLFFTEQVRVGDVLIAENDAPTTLAEWTTVQNNIDLASLTQIGIGNVNAGTGIDVSYTSGTATVTNTGVTSLAAGEGIDVSGSTGAVTVSAEDSSATNKGIVIVSPGEAIDVSYASGTATVSVEDSTASNKGAVIVSAGTGISVSYASGTATVTNTDSNSDNTATGTITAGNTSGTVTHNWGTLNTIVQTIDSSGDTVFCDISRTTNTAVATIATAQAGDITILVQKIG